MKSKTIGYFSLAPFAISTLLAWLGLDLGLALFQNLSILLLVFLLGNFLGSLQALTEVKAKQFYFVALLLLWGLIAWFVPYLLSMIMLILGFVALFLLEMSTKANNFFKQNKSMSWILISGLIALHVVVFFIADNP